MQQIQQKKVAEKNEVLITRIINAPRALVYACWTNAERLKSWYFPDNCTVKFTSVDIRVGGGFHGAIIHGDKEGWFRAIFKEMTPPEKLVFTITREDEDGNRLTPEAAGMPKDWSGVSLVTLTFEDLGKQTRFTLHHTVDLDLAKGNGAYSGWLQMLDRMESLIVQ